MFRPKQPQIPANYRLPKMQKILSETDLQFVLSEAGNKRGTTIEMPFLAGTQTYMLTVVLAQDSNDAMWSYYRGDDAQAQLLWRHGTGDVNLILNLCGAESGAPDVGYTAVSKTNSLPHLQAETQRSLTNTYTGINPIVSQQGTPANPSISTGNNLSSLSGGPGATLAGDLSNMQLPTLLQSISMSKMTGKLRLDDNGQQAVVYFNDGNPVHAATAESTGDQAIVEMITWEEGTFQFFPNEQTNESSVKRRVDSILMEGVTLLDQNKFVKEQGVKPQSYLFRKNAQLTEEQFKEALTRGAPLDFETQKKFYSIVDGASPFVEILRRMPMIKIEWVPIMFNMLACGLLGVSDTPPAGVSVAPLLSIPPFEIDRAAIAGVHRTLVRPETNVFTYPAFLYFLEQEFGKCAAMGMPLSLCVFEMNLRVGNELQPMPLNFAKEVLKRMETVKRPFDTLGHFETFQYALFMPNTPGKGAKVFGVRLMEILANDPPIPRVAGTAVIRMGVAAAPEDTMDLPLLLSAAREAKKRGIESGSGVTVFREISQR